MTETNNRTHLSTRTIRCGTAERWPQE